MAVGKCNIDYGLLASTPSDFECSGSVCLHTNYSDSNKAPNHLSIWGPRTPALVSDCRSLYAHSVRPFLGRLEGKKDLCRSPSHSQPLPPPPSQEKQWYLVIAFRYFILVYLFIQAFVHSVAYSFNKYFWELACRADETTAETTEAETEPPKLCVNAASASLQDFVSRMWKLSQLLQSHLPSRPFLWGFLQREKIAARACQRTLSSHSPPSTRDGPPAPQPALALSCASEDSKTSWEWEVAALACKGCSLHEEPSGRTESVSERPSEVPLHSCLHRWLGPQVSTTTQCICVLGKKLPQVQWLKRTRIYYLTVLKVGNGFLLEAQGENVFPCLFQHLEMLHDSWLLDPFLHLQNQQCSICKTCISGTWSISHERWKIKLLRHLCGLCQLNSIIALGGC